jgi:hypothetical protein
MNIEIVKERYEASGVTMVLSVKMAYGEPLLPIPGFPDEQMPPSQFELLKAVLGREISALFWGRTALPRPLESVLESHCFEVRKTESQTSSATFPCQA